MLDQASRRRRAQSTRSQLATELLLTGFALVAAIVILRTVLVLMDINDRIWIGKFVYGLTSPVTDALDFLPGADRIVVSELTVVDVTLIGVLLLFLLGIVATGRRTQAR